MFVVKVGRREEGRWASSDWLQGCDQMFSVQFYKKKTKVSAKR